MKEIRKVRVYRWEFTGERLHRCLTRFRQVSLKESFILSYQWKIQSKPPKDSRKLPQERGPVCADRCGVPAWTGEFLSARSPACSRWARRWPTAWAARSSDRSPARSSSGPPSTSPGGRSSLGPPSWSPRRPAHTSCGRSAPPPRRSVTEAPPCRPGAPFVLLLPVCLASWQSWESQRRLTFSTEGLTHHGPLQEACRRAGGQPAATKRLNGLD